MTGLKPSLNFFGDFLEISCGLGSNHSAGLRAHLRYPDAASVLYRRLLREVPDAEAYVL